MLATLLLLPSYGAAQSTKYKKGDQVPLFANKVCLCLYQCASAGIKQKLDRERTEVVRGVAPSADFVVRYSGYILVCRTLIGGRITEACIQLLHSAQLQYRLLAYPSTAYPSQPPGRFLSA